MSTLTVAASVAAFVLYFCKQRHLAAQGRRARNPVALGQHADDLAGDAESEFDGERRDLEPVHPAGAREVGVADAERERDQEERGGKQNRTEKCLALAVVVQVLPGPGRGEPDHQQADPVGDQSHGLRGVHA